MKKTLILVGMLSIVYVKAQEEDGKVGINTVTPAATMDVRVSNINLEGTTNEGILIPRLSKERVAKMVSPEISTVVYVNDASYTGEETTIANVDAVGFYHYNGTQWVKFLDTDTNTNEGIWVKDGEDAKLDYPNSNYTTKYLANGAYTVYPTEDVTYPSVSATNSKELYNWNILTENNRFHKTLVNASDVAVNDTNGGVGSSINIYKLDEDKTNAIETNAHTTQSIISKDNIFANKAVRNIFYNVEHLGNTRLRSMEGLYASAALNAQNSSANAMVGGYFDVVSNSDVEVGDMYASRNRVRLNGSGNIARVFGTRIEIARSGNTTNVPSSNIGNLYGLYVGYSGLGAASNYTGVITNAYDFYAEASNGGTMLERLTNAYGVFIRGAHKINYLAGQLGVGTDTPSAKIDAVDASAQIAGKYFHKVESSTALAANEKYILTVRDAKGTDAGTTLEENRTYEIVLNTNSGTYHTGSKYIVYFDSITKAWVSKLVSSSGIEQSTQLAIASSGNQLEVWHGNTAVSYYMRAQVVGVNYTTTSGASPYVFGLEGSMTNINSNIGIGTETPTEKLQVEGNILASGNVKATSFTGINGATIFPDYVFQKYYTGNSTVKADYVFNTLNQVEDFVRNNGHLPGYKSAEVIKKQGYIDLMETQLTNVEKIEELYLHLIEKDKQLNSQNEELKKLKIQNDELMIKNHKLEVKNQDLEARLERLEEIIK